MVRKFVIERNLKLVIAFAGVILLIVAVLGYSANNDDPVSGIVTTFGSIARTFWKPPQ